MFLASTESKSILSPSRKLPRHLPDPAQKPTPSRELQLDLDLPDFSSLLHHAEIFHCPAPIATELGEQSCSKVSLPELKRGMLRNLYWRVEPFVGLFDSLPEINRYHLINQDNIRYFLTGMSA